MSMMNLAGIKKGSLLYEREKALIKQNMNALMSDMMRLQSDLEKVGELEKADKVRISRAMIKNIQTQL